MDKSLSRSDQQGIRLHLDRAEVLAATVDQLRKDLAVGADEIIPPDDPANAFEHLQAQVAPVLRALATSGDHALRVAMYRVDIAEAHLRRTLDRGGPDALAGEVVLRALQKVLTRMRFAGRY
ncbi:MAG: hypothetical protein JNJ91_06495 [Flavobacteriales bacterium]|nr:hypothetical protein [Flavobacteriales bacterium]